MKYILILSFLFLTGCSKQDQPSNENSTAIKKEVKYVNTFDVQKLLDEKKGKILFVNFWATWCPPCVAEFPDIVKLHNNYKDKNLEVISLSVDFGKNADSLVSNFMAQQKAEFPAYIVEEKSSEEVINLFNKDWNGAVPVTFIYDKNFNQKNYFVGAQSYEEFENAVKKITQ